MNDTPTIPPMGLGTFGRTGDEGVVAVLDALAIGYRHIDTAQTYDTETPIGRALRQSGLKRDEVFITTKIADTKLKRADFMPSLRSSLEGLGVDYVDLTLIHWPSHRDAVPLAEYMEELARAKELGLTRLIGVSNFTIDHLARSLTFLGPGALATNQIEMHPYLQNRRVHAWCAANGVSVTAYMPLAKGRVAADPVIAGIAARRGETPAAVALAFLLQRGVIVIPASGRREHMVANFRATGFKLTDDEMAAIAALERGDRMINPAKSPAWD
jgi:2,5-diketo-D-gluconate reductase B